MTARILIAAIVLCLGTVMPLYAATYYVANDAIAPDGSTTAYTKIEDAYAAAASDTVASVVVVMPGLLTNQGSLVLSEPMVAVRGYGPSASALGSGIAIVVQDEAHLANIEVCGAITSDFARLFLSNVRLGCTPTCASNIVGTFIVTNGAIRVRNLAPAEELSDAVNLGQLNSLTGNLNAASITTGVLSEERIDTSITRNTQLDAATNSLAQVYVKKSGDTMSGVLNMGGYAITNLATPTVPSAATPKSYVDSAITNIPHNALGNRAWSVAGHTIDTNVDFNFNSIANIKSATGRITNGQNTSAYNFNSSNNRIDSSFNQSSLTSFSISAWIKTTEAGGLRAFMNNSDGGGNAIMLGIGSSGVGAGGSGKVIFTCAANNLEIGIFSTSTINDGAWNAFSLTYTNNALDQITSRSWTGGLTVQGRATPENTVQALDINVQPATLDTDGVYVVESINVNVGTNNLITAVNKAYPLPPNGSTNVAGTKSLIWGSIGVRPEQVTHKRGSIGVRPEQVTHKS